MAFENPLLIDLPMPIRTTRLMIRPKQPGDGAATAAAIKETWTDLHQWMGWAESLEQNTAEKQEIRARQVMASFVLREEINLVGVEIGTGQLAVWCGFHNLEWSARQGETGFWVRKNAQGHGYATEATNALIRYAFKVLNFRRLGITHSAGNYASRRVIEKLGFIPEGIQRQANLLPDGRVADRHLYARFNADNLPDLDVQWT